MAILLRYGAIIAVLITVSAPALHASDRIVRPDSTIQVPYQQPRVFNIDSTGQPDTANPVDVRYWGPQERFEYQSDSMRFRIHVGEIALNRRGVFLANWSFGQCLNWNDSTQDAQVQYTNEQLSKRSTTYFFPISSGDTVSFYRSIYWSNKFKRGPAPTTWVGPDNMYYSVEVVDSATLSRIALLDTFEMLATTNTPGRNPSFFTWYPLASRVQWVAPSAVGTGRKVLVRVNVRTAGSENRLFFRSDIYARHHSFSDLGHPGWTAFMDAAYASNVRSTTNCGIVVATVQGGVNIHTTAQTDQLRVVDLTGATFWEGPAATSEQPQHVPLIPGRYIAVRLVNGVVVCTFSFVLTP